MLANASGGLIARWLDFCLAGFFAAVAVGFCLYAALFVRTVTRVVFLGVSAPPRAQGGIS
jgi:hypothetical protein